MPNVSSPASRSSLQPARQLAGRGQPNDRGRSDRRQLRTSASASAVGSLSRFSTPMASPPGASRPTAIWAMFTLCCPKIVPDRADNAGHVVVAKHEQAAVQIGLQPAVVERHQPRHVLAKNRAGRLVLPRDRTSPPPSSTSGTNPSRERDSSDEFDAALLEQDLGVDEIDFLVERALQQPGREHRRQNLGFSCRRSRRDTAAGTTAARRAPSRPAACPTDRRHPGSRAARPAFSDRATRR